VTNKSLFGRRVLVVEDEMMTLMLIEDMLADLGCESVATAATAEQALALIDKQVFDAAMLDMNLNGEKSHAVADALAARGVPFVFSTGYSGNDIPVHLNRCPYARARESGGNNRRSTCLRQALASTFPAGAIVVFIPWCRGAEARAANRERA